ncbi:hypothetical protein HII31_04023 [Pseudocercospora fuligena]|uniref:Uncharacterized protein n=1 Tax=Pseudocercospora fuligena TaxID=685502 RepID=A0A8H6VL92_9PEZI|nr:hypothetical protein HII31_04023 [Pseudocercospora fuligena]
MSTMVLGLGHPRLYRAKSVPGHAIACVVSKVRQVVTGVALERKMLLCYTEALHLLRSAVADPALHDRLDMLAATQLLAIYEMLDSTSNESWLQHVAGAAAMAKLHDDRDQRSIKGTHQAAPMFVEALLNDDEYFFSGPHWKALLHVIITKRFPCADLTAETVSCFTTLRSVFSDAHRAFVNNVAIDWSIRLPLLARAHELRCRLKTLTLQSEQQFASDRKASPKGVDLLGLCLITIIMLDRLITALRRDLPSRGRDLEADTQELCTQMIRLELEAAEKHPGKDVLLAFQRQVNYPMLTYNE